MGLFRPFSAIGKVVTAKLTVADAVASLQEVLNKLESVAVTREQSRDIAQEQIRQLESQVVADTNEISHARAIQTKLAALLG